MNPETSSESSYVAVNLASATQIPAANPQLCWLSHHLITIYVGSVTLKSPFMLFLHKPKSLLSDQLRQPLKKTSRFISPRQKNWNGERWTTERYNMISFTIPHINDIYQCTLWNMI